MDPQAVSLELAMLSVALEPDPSRADATLWTSCDDAIQLEWSEHERLWTARRMFCYPYAEMPPRCVLRFTVTQFERGEVLWCVQEAATVGQALAGVGLNDAGLVPVGSVRQSAAEAMRVLAAYGRGEPADLAQALQDVVDAVRTMQAAREEVGRA